MSESRFRELEERLKRTEAEIQWLRHRRISPTAIGLFSLISAGAGFFIASSAATRAQPGANPGSEVLRPTHSVEAPFEVRGKGGKAIIRVEDTPAPSLWVLGNEGSVRLVINEYGGAVSIRGSAGLGQMPTAMFYDAGGNGVVNVSNKAGESLAQLRGDGVSALIKGRVVARLGPAPNGAAGYLSIGDNNGNALVEAGNLNGRGIVRAYPYKPRTGEILQGSNFIIGAKN